VRGLVVLEESLWLLVESVAAEMYTTHMHSCILFVFYIISLIMSGSKDVERQWM